MKKLLLILLIFLPSSFAFGAECYHQRNPMGYANYDICEVTGTGYICVSLEGKSNTLSCFPAPKYYESPTKREVIRNSDGSFDPDYH